MWARARASFARITCGDPAIRRGRPGTVIRAPLHRLQRVGHIDDDHAVRHTRLAHADELLALHREIGERDALRVDAGARELRMGRDGGVDGLGAPRRHPEMPDLKIALRGFVRRASARARTDTTSLTVTGGVAMIAGGERAGLQPEPLTPFGCTRDSPRDMQAARTVACGFIARATNREGFSGFTNPGEYLNLRRRTRVTAIAAVGRDRSSLISEANRQNENKSAAPRRSVRTRKSSAGSNRRVPCLPPAERASRWPVASLRTRCSSMASRSALPWRRTRSEGACVVVSAR